MSTRRRSNPPISLLSFQDIITSVAGVMIFLALIMALQLVVQTTEASPSEATSQLNAQLEDALAAAEDDMRALQREARDIAAALQRRAGETTITLASKQSALEREIAGLRQDVAELAGDESRSKQRRNEAASRAAKNAKVDEKLNKLLRKNRQTQEKIDELRAENRLIYVPQPGSGKKAWLMQVSGDAILAAEAGESAEPIPFPGSSIAQQLVAAERWARKLDGRRNYLVLIVKPSGVDVFDTLLARLKLLPLDVGFDLIDEQHTVVSQPSE